jgi:DNA-binding winged helix-turn-helix (wHTH) protein
MRLTFGRCLFDSGTREVSRDGRPVAISPKAFQLLEILIERRPNAVSKEQLHELLWPKTFVTDANLPNLVAELRSGLGDDARRPRIIRTVPRFGYAFSGEAGPEPGQGAPAPEHVVFRLLWADREIALREGENILGRERDAAGWIDVYSVSRRHARIVVSGETATLEDLGSKNGTFLQGEAITKPCPLSDGDRLRIGTVEMTVRRYVGGVSTQSVRSQ